MKGSVCKSLKEKKEQFYDKHFDNMFITLLAFFYVVAIFVSSFCVSQIIKFEVTADEELVWRDTAISLKEKYENKKITVPVNNADVTIDGDVVYIWQGIAKPAITYDFSDSEVEAKINNVWCIILCIPTFIVFMILTTLVIGGILYVLVNVERYIFKKIEEN